MAINVAFCVKREAFTRLGRSLRQLLVGLVDEAIPLRLLSSDPRVERLSLGPIQTVVHPPIRWPVNKKRLKILLDTLAHNPPTIVHAISGDSFHDALMISSAFDADLVLHLTSLDDCREIARLQPDRTTRFIVPTGPLREALVDQRLASFENVSLIRPGILASRRIACFSDPKRVPSLICTSDLERGCGHARLVEAAKLLHRDGRELMIFLLGKGGWERQVRKMIRQQGLLSCFTLSSPLGDPAQAMESADIFVRPSVESSLIFGGLQAMAAGNAVVTFENTVSDYYRDGETAIVCSQPTAESLAETIEMLIRDREYARKIAVGGQEYVRENHSISNMAEQTASLYRQLALSNATIAMKE